MKRLLQACALAIGVVAAAAQIAFAQTPTAEAQGTTLHLSAYGEVKVQPDMASLMLGVQTEAPTAAAALSANAEQMARVMAALKRAGVAERDLRTSQLSVNPKYVYEQNQPPKLTGYQASNQLTVISHDLKRLGQLIDTAAGAGATNINGVSFGLADPRPAQDAARLEAVKALQARAALYANALGHPIARLVTFSEGGGYDIPPPPPPPPVAYASMRAAQTSVSPGELDIQVQVSGVYELAR
jgi:uncharacterized protein YggE